MSSPAADPARHRPTPEGHPALCTLRLHRPATGHAGLRRVQVLVDGHVAALLSEGDTTDYGVPPGEHRLWAHLDWASGEQSQITIAAGELVELHVVPDGPALSPLRNEVSSLSYRLIGAPGSGPVIQATADPARSGWRLIAATGVQLCLAVVVLVFVLLLAGGALS